MDIIHLICNIKLSAFLLPITGHFSERSFENSIGLSGLFLTTCCQKLRFQVSAIKKFQITNHKYQTNNKDRNSKIQTDDPLAFVPNGIITGGLKIWAAIRYDRVECFGHWILKFEIYL
jgi:hypothetical protein